MSQRDSFGFGRVDNTAVVANVLNSIASKESSYKQQIKGNHVIAKGAAKRIHHFETTLAGHFESVMSADEWQSYLAQQKEDIKNVAASNIANERGVETFCRAVRSVQVQLQQKQQQQAAAAKSTDDGDDGMDDGDEAMVDYGKMINDAVATVEAQSKAAQLDLQQETYYREISHLLGEKVAPAKKRGRGGGDDDDEIEVEESYGAGGSADGGNLKCPISGTYMEDAVRNKVCSHVYSRAGIMSHIGAKNHRCRCPMPGCMNQNVTADQLEEDIETKMNVKRALRLESQRKEHQASQASDLMDSDEE